MSTAAPATLDAALTYAQRGWRVVPIKCGEKRPPLNEWQRQATTDEALIRDWWARWPDFGVGIATGPESGIFVLDVDVSEGKQGDETLADLEAEHGPLPATVETITGSGGRHLYFRYPPGADIRNESSAALGPGLDIRGVGGQVLAPPTLHPNGKRYEWEASGDPADVAVAEAPAWLVELLTRRPDPAAAKREHAPRTDDDQLPGDRFAAEVSWPELLEADGAHYLGTRVDRHSGHSYELWARPGVNHTSATLYYGGSDVLKVFTPNWGGIDRITGAVWQLVEGETYTRFGYYAARHHDGDHAAAASELRRQQGGGRSIEDWLANEVLTRTSEPLEAPQKPQSNIVAGEDWGEPTPLGAPPPAPYPLDVLPSWMAGACAVLATQLQVPVDLCAQIALGAWSGACAGKAKIALTPRWAEHLNLFLATAMPSGSGKSPASKVLTAPLRSLEAELVEQYRKVIAEAKAEAHMLDKRVSEAKKGGDPAELALAVLAAETHEVPASPRLVVDDVTPEALALLLHRHRGRMALISTEAAVFDQAVGIYGRSKPNINVFLQGWSADPLVIDRKGSSAGEGTEIRIAEPLLTVSITVQPSTIAELRKHPELAGRGFVSRFMYAVPTSLLGQRDRWKVLAEGGDEALRSYMDTFRRLARRCASWERPATLSCTQEATGLFIGWQHDMEQALGTGGELEAIAEWTAKLHGSVLRTAGLFHLADEQPTSAPVNGATMSRAVELGRYWISHARVVADLWGSEEVVYLAKRVLARLAADDVDEVTLRDVYRTHHRELPTAEDALPVCRLLVDEGWLRPLFEGPLVINKRGQPSPRFAVRPDLRSHLHVTHVTKNGGISNDQAGGPSVMSPMSPPPLERDKDRTLSLSLSNPLSMSKNGDMGDMREGGSDPPSSWLLEDIDRGQEP